MEVTRVVITDMPGPVWWEFFLQWGGVLTQAAAAIGTVWAVVVALRVAGAQQRWRLEDLARERRVVRIVVERELMELGAPLDNLIEAFAHCTTIDELSNKEAYEIIATVDSCKDMLELPRTWSMVDRLGHLDHAEPLAEVLAALPLLTSVCEDISKNYGSPERLLRLAGFIREINENRKKAMA